MQLVFFKIPISCILKFDKSSKVCLELKLITFHCKDPPPLSPMKPIFCSIFLLTLPRTFSGFKLCSWCTWSNLFWTSFVQKNCTIYFWLFVFLMFVNLYRSQRSCENLLKYPAWKYLLKEHAPHFSLKCVQTCKQSLMLVLVKKVFISLKIFISLNESELW